jgi:hypothetical protein
VSNETKNTGLHNKKAAAKKELTNLKWINLEVFNSVKGKSKVVPNRNYSTV